MAYDNKIDLREPSSGNTLAPPPAPRETIMDSPSRNLTTAMQEAEQQKESGAEIIHKHWIHIDGRKWNRIINIYCGPYSRSDWYLEVEGIKDLEVVKVHSSKQE